MATAEEIALLTSILTLVGRGLVKPLEVTASLAMAGQHYNRSLMVVGQALYGWTDSIMSQELANPDRAAHFAFRVRASVENPNGRCPMRWVTDTWDHPKPGETHTNKRSAFWRVVRGIVERLGIADTQDETWPSSLVWSNLYKVAPADQQETQRACSGQHRRAGASNC